VVLLRQFPIAWLFADADRTNGYLLQIDYPSEVFTRIAPTCSALDINGSIGR